MQYKGKGTLTKPSRHSLYSQIMLLVDICSLRISFGNFSKTFFRVSGFGFFLKYVLKVFKVQEKIKKFGLKFSIKKTIEKYCQHCKELGS